MDQPERTPSPQQHRPCTILIADDDSAIMALLANVLRQHKFAVVTACDGIQALAAARAHPDRIDLLVSDIEMPNMDGIQLVAEIRQMLPGIGVILMSGAPNQEAAVGDEIFLRKPFAPAELLEAIAGLLGKPPSAFGHAS